MTTYPGQNTEPLYIVEINVEDEYFIEAVLDFQIHQEKL
jgi:hypothetical protein